jgi:hypothetical protein
MFLLPFFTFSYHSVPSHETSFPLLYIHTYSYILVCMLIVNDGS